MIDVLFLAHNRLEFTQRSFRHLVDNTAWERVRKLVVYDDGSQPHARLWLQDACAEFYGCPVDFRVRTERWGSPVAIMADYLERDPAEWFAKIDNDIAMCPGWLDAMLYVLDDHPEVDLLGCEAGMTRVRGDNGNDPHEPPTFEPSTHIGGIGLMRTEAFEKARHRLIWAGPYFGFTEFQHRNRSIVRGWITPDLPCPLLDRLPVEPFVSLSREYRAQGWQRNWGTYDFEGWMSWSYDWVLEKEVECAASV